MNRIFSVFMLSCLFISGCAIDAKEKSAMVDKKLEDIYFRLESIEDKMEAAEQRLNTLEDNYNELAKRKEELSPAPAVKDTMTTKDVQLALKNAGFYNGPIDGKIGPGVESAIKGFQKANGLKADGIAGAKTKALLIKHLTSQSY